MLLNAFAQTLYQRRGVSSAVLSNVAISTPSQGWNISGTGMGADYTATLHYKIGYSVQSPALEPIIAEGDEITFSPQTTPTEERMIVSAVTKCYRRGILDHYEVQLT